MKILERMKYLLMLVDIISFSTSLLLSTFFLFILTDDIYDYIPPVEIRERIVIYFSLVFFGIFWFWIRLRHYTYRKPFWFELKEIFRTLMILACVELSIIAFSKLYFSRYFWLTTWGVVFLFLPLLRVSFKFWLIRKGAFLKNTIIIGGGSNAIDAYQALKSEPYLGLDVKYFLSTNPNAELSKLGIPVLDNHIENLSNYISYSYDQFIVALEENQVEERDYWLRFLSKNKCRYVSIIPDLRGLPLYGTDLSFLFGYDMILLRVNNNLAKRSSRIIKRIIDIILSLLGLIVLFPLFIYVSWKIKQDGGCIIYGHKRIGRNGQVFSCLKFRTMVENSEQVLQTLLATDPLAKAEWEKDFKLKNDPRITSIGRFLRRTSLDELPQLWNVLKGEMSLVGPRPVISDELPRYEDNVDYYFMAKPGMTGIWQVSGRNDIDYQKRVYLDSWYVKNWSLWNDLVILCKTISVVIHRRGAY